MRESVINLAADARPIHTQGAVKQSGPGLADLPRRSDSERHTRTSGRSTVSDSRLNRVLETSRPFAIILTELSARAYNTPRPPPVKHSSLSCQLYSFPSHHGYYITLTCVIFCQTF